MPIYKLLKPTAGQCNIQPLTDDLNEVVIEASRADFSGYIARFKDHSWIYDESIINQFDVAKWEDNRKLIAYGIGVFNGDSSQIQLVFK
ncbi:hypothetical protein D5018_20345 [Parashewanella curva]|uniref:Uncharacterized protein n=1 Tax=Parashewanella curva TaxID=2338552 RepID=A0A3L8PUZ3_9GAMM|nr:hypothetical protein [Parashewanella curva]RLV57852.1 hypothetical protein D5018_20345 [Parashewanella curva]